MAKGAKAKDNLIKKIIAAVGDNYIGEYDKKYYFWSEEDGENIQVSISMTCPKNPIVTVDTTAGYGDLDFEDMDQNTTISKVTFEPAEITEDEMNMINQLKAKLNF